MATTEFSSWRRATLVHESEAKDGLLGRNLQVTLTDSVAGAAAPDDVAIVFRSPAHVARLTQDAIRHRAPGPGVADAETTKCTHIDFHSPDLPWRYTPEPAAGDRLRPWMALIVGTADEVKVAGDVVTIVPALLAEPEHQLAKSWRWAHVHAPTGDSPDQLGVAAPHRLSRLLSLRTLTALTTYHAVVVPGFNAAGKDMWDAQGNVSNGGKPLPVLASWSFTTGEGGDFETLAAQLRMPPARDVGKARLRYRAGPVDVGPVDVRGALSSLQSVQEAPAAGQDLVAQQMALAVRPGDPELLGLPEYGLPWVAAPSTVTSGWVQQLRDDARVRIHAGTGTWVGVEAQDELMRAAVEQAGALQDAAGKIARTAAGVAASGSLWERALPADPIDRLTVLAPLTTRILVDLGGAVLADAVTGVDRNLDRSLLTAAGRRLLSRSARIDRTPTASAAELLALANDPPPAAPPDFSELAVQWQEARPADGEQVLWMLWEALAAFRAVGRAAHSRYRAIILPEAEAAGEEGFAHVEQELVDREQDSFARPRELLEQIPLPCWDEPLEGVAQSAGALGWVDLLERIIRSGNATTLIYGPVQTAMLRCLIQCDEPPHEPDEPPSRCELQRTLLRIPAPWDLQPIDLGGLAGNLFRAIDPRSLESPARRSLREQIGGLTVDSLAPPRFPLGLDFPTWSLLRTHEPDWFLPGAQTVDKHAILALRTNPAFIDAYLVGLNAQFLSEVRWRGLSVDRWGTPLRMFFATVDARDGKRTPDITPIDLWPPGSPLGSRTHQSSAPAAGAEGAAERLVLLFHTPLFRRYPRTLVYLQRTSGDPEIDDLILQDGPTTLNPPPNATKAEVAQWYTSRQHIAPSFTGTMNPELVFFVFDIAPTVLDEFLLILDEPPGELRFRNDQNVEPASDSAGVADITHDARTRIVISGALLEEQGRNPG
jgi:hypothetical protein